MSRLIISTITRFFHILNVFFKVTHVAGPRLKAVLQICHMAPQLKQVIFRSAGTRVGSLAVMASRQSVVPASSPHVEAVSTVHLSKRGANETGNYAYCSDARWIVYSCGVAAICRTGASTLRRSGLNRPSVDAWRGGARLIKTPLI